MSNHLPVLIVGAGPTGLTAAIGLQRYGIPFRIIDKQIKPVTTSNAIVIQSRTLEVWDDLGLLSQALQNGNPIREFTVFANNKKIATVNLNLLEGVYQFSLGLAQSQTEQMMHTYLHAQRIPIETEVELSELQEQKDSVLVTLRHKDGKTETVTTDWLLACDGGHSFVRDKLQLAFQGKELTQHFIVADVYCSTLIAQQDLELFLSEDGPLILARYNKENMRIIAEVTGDAELHAAKVVTDAQIKRILAARCPIPLQIEKSLWTSGFWIHERLITQYSRERIFFLGDAAHLHSPAGGQGMNTGIQDAYNLTWKLALVIQGYAARVLLDSYHEERHRVAKALLRNTTVTTHMITLKNKWLQKLRNFIMQLVMKSEKNRKKLTMLFSQLAVNYCYSTWVHDCCGHQPGPAAGMRMIDVVIDGQRLFDKVRGREFCLLVFSGQQPELGLSERLAELQSILCEKYLHVVRLILVTPDAGLAATWQGDTWLDTNAIAHQRYHVVSSMFYLLRPDKYISFRGELRHQPELMQYFKKVFV
ncbi:MAG: hypothetical protein A3E83_02900 [Gammaproteobacteria bacterium RIFCSPHIGHO2_12_FULL_41_20]|nr:MAG: hypothetical protein A3E83_02900 [Gammaproteobacteria bacterium RIFCSPHIGHO2_12_FULL_41_20]